MPIVIYHTFFMDSTPRHISSHKTLEGAKAHIQQSAKYDYPIWLLQTSGIWTLHDDLWEPMYHTYIVSGYLLD